MEVILMRLITLVVVACVFLSSCASTGVVKMDRGVYMIAQKSAMACCGPPSETVKAEVYTEANEFCAKTNQDVETIDQKVVDTMLMRPGSFTLTFRCVSPNQAGE